MGNGARHRGCGCALVVPRTRQARPRGPCRCSSSGFRASSPGSRCYGCRTPDAHTGGSRRSLTMFSTSQRQTMRYLIDLPSSSETNARHASQKVTPSGPSELRGSPTLVRKVPNSCSGSSGRSWSNLGRSGPTLIISWPKFGQHWPSWPTLAVVAKNWPVSRNMPNLDEFWRVRANFGHHLAGFSQLGLIWPTLPRPKGWLVSEKIGRFWPCFAEVCQTRATFDQFWRGPAHILPNRSSLAKSSKFGRTRPRVDQSQSPSGPKFGGLRPESMRSNFLGNFWTIFSKFGLHALRATFG